MPRSLSTKLVLAAVGAVIVPFLGLALFIGSEIDTRLEENVVQHTLQGIAADLAGELDLAVRERNTQLLLLADEMPGAWAIEEYETERDAGADPVWGPRAMEAWLADREPGAPWPEESLWRRTQAANLDRHVRIRGVYDLLLLVASDGRLVTTSTARPDGGDWGPGVREALFARDFSGEPWFERALAGHLARVDQHASPYLPPPPEGVDPSRGYHVALATPVHRFGERERAGVLLALVNWSTFQSLVDAPEIQATFSGLVRDKKPSPYAWIWGSDADTILGHKDRSLYGASITRDLDLGQMTEDARRGPAGLYREYEFRGVRKNAAYHHCRGPGRDDGLGGFGWIVGVGIDNEDIFAMAGEVRGVLYRSTAAVLLFVVLWIMVIARRTTSPIRALQQHTRRVAEGDLDVDAIEVRTGDELEHLASDFNEMVRELREKRAALVRAEKDAAWREMARQIAHEIKNPLTPIKLSMDLLKRARADRSPDYEAILERTLVLLENQVANLRQIATDFYEFTGGRRAPLEDADLGVLMADVLALHRAWAGELGVTLGDEGELRAAGRIVRADPRKLQRVLSNLVANAFQAMPRGGRLEVALRAVAGRVVLEIRDTGVGLSDEVREHLFEPYFTTRSEGTGLGLAIARRVVEELGGAIALEPAPEGPGTVARVELPEAGSAGDARPSDPPDPARGGPAA